MKIIKKNIWLSELYSSICIPTNGVIKKDGNSTWGAGIAKQAAIRWPKLPKIHANFLKEKGHSVGYIANIFLNEKIIKLFTFPTKFHWKDKSDIKLIERSANQLVDISQQDEYKNEYFAIPAPGCGCGGLEYSEIFPKLEKILIGNRFIVFYM